MYPIKAVTPTLSKQWRGFEHQLRVLPFEWVALAGLIKGVFVGFQDCLGYANHVLFVRV
ncbi:hypothetical protein SAMN04489801_2006 [Pseudomonas mandelii]|uniref:Uncharacterized protein n=1 Tax=Pseudomonas mandelii TaxID=75612 RepID=A0ABY0VID7_9PSED|nr:hypothetical protein SAMN04489801_2006 [Pseudomonas mandelii]